MKKCVIENKTDLKPISRNYDFLFSLSYVLVLIKLVLKYFAPGFVLIVLATSGCQSAKGMKTDNHGTPINKSDFTVPGEYNLKINVTDVNINTPDNDRYSYYKIYIDKMEEGRTTTGLETQKKTFEGKYSVNKHLLKIEKMVLDPKKNEYIRLNNISQPKPDFIYFDIQEGKVTVIDIENDVEQMKTIYNLDFERK